MIEVVRIIYSRDRLRRVEVFRREDGSFGFKEDWFSGDPLERCWINYAVRHSESFCPSEQIVLREVVGRVGWLNELIAAGELIEGLPRPIAAPHPPKEIGGAIVRCLAAFSAWQSQTGLCRNIVSENIELLVAGLAICQYSDDPGYYLFRCDANWRAITDTYHDSIAEAKSQAEFEYVGIGATWRTMSRS